MREMKFEESPAELKSVSGTEILPQEFIYIASRTNSAKYAPHKLPCIRVDVDGDAASTCEVILAKYLFSLSILVYHA